MSGNKNIPTKNYKLISAYIRLNQSRDEEDLQNQLFDRKLKGFHLFCVILYGVFLIDGQIPSTTVDTTITGVKALTFETSQVSMSYKGVTKTKKIITPTSVQITTDKGNFITNEITGFETKSTKVSILKTPLFKVNSMLHYKEKNIYVKPEINFSGNFLFWPIISFLISIICLVTKRFYGSTTLAVIAILNFVPFFLVVYLEKVY